MAGEFFEHLKKIKAFAFDLDGVWTNGQLLLAEDGSELRQMNVKDGYAAKRALQAQMKMAIISGKTSEAIRARYANLGIAHVYLGENHKVHALERFLVENRIEKSEVLAMGDDLPDRELLEAAGIATCPADAVPEIANICHYQSDKAGGQGCVRDIIEKTLKLKEAWDH